MDDIDTPSPTTIKIADLEYSSKNRMAKRGNTSIKLTCQELKLLNYLVKNSGKILTRDMILNELWLSSINIETRIVDVYIGYLRKKIDKGYDKKLIHSVRGFGYIMKE